WTPKTPAKGSIFHAGSQLDPDDADILRHAISGIAAFLRDWLMDHIIEEDLQMKPYLSADRDP
ncbi:MAG: hypothetical protein HN403_20455, partial [Rhodospirillales bacterium]|nr:hypothetical protein [Rhodospirillales bacterium]